MAKSAGFFRPGEGHMNAKLTDAKVRYIRRSGDSLGELAKRFGVHSQRYITPEPARLGRM
jgi:hypothetical protein